MIFPPYAPAVLIRVTADRLAELGHELQFRGNDDGALEAALARAEHLSVYEDVQDPCRWAAAVAMSIGRYRHPLVDGNKRLAAEAVGLVLALSNFELDVTNRDLEAKILGLTDCKNPETYEIEFAGWLSRNCVPFPED